MWQRGGPLLQNVMNNGYVFGLLYIVRLDAVFCMQMLIRSFMLLLSVNASLSAVLEALVFTRLPGSLHLVMSWC